MTREDARGHLFDRLAVGDVAELVLAADLVRERPQALLAARQQDALPAAPGEQPRDLRADSATTLR